MPECWECGYKSLFEEHFVLGGDDVFRCNVCDDEYKENRIMLMAEEATAFDGSDGEVL
jgi:hypothetical protein